MNMRDIWRRTATHVVIFGISMAGLGTSAAGIVDAVREKQRNKDSSEAFDTFTAKVREAGAANLEVLERHATGIPVDDMQHVRASVRNETADAGDINQKFETTRKNLVLRIKIFETTGAVSLFGIAVSGTLLRRNRKAMDARL